MRCWSTDEAKDDERFAQWRERRTAALFGVAMELDPPARGRFGGRLAWREVADATLVELAASSYRVRRSKADIARAPGEALYIWEQRAGASWIDDGRGGRFAVTAGALALGGADSPYAATPDCEDFCATLVKIPAWRGRALVGGAEELVVRPIDAGSPMGALLHAYFHAFVAEAPRLDGPCADAAVDALTRLGLMAYGAAAPADARAVTAGRLHAVQRYLAQNMHRPDLSPKIAAQALGLSLRSLHGLFEPTGASFARTVTARRLERFRAHLARDRRVPIIEAMLAAGFESSTVF